MFCETCGFEIEEDDRFCRKCGKALDGAAAEQIQGVCMRKRKGRMVAGVCSGCASYFGKDPTTLRVIWAIAAVIPPIFPGVVAYLVCWLLLPVDPAEEAPAADRTAAAH